MNAGGCGWSQIHAGLSSVWGGKNHAAYCPGLGGLVARHSCVTACRAAGCRRAAADRGAVPAVGPSGAATSASALRRTQAAAVPADAEDPAAQALNQGGAPSFSQDGHKAKPARRKHVASKRHHASGTERSSIIGERASGQAALVEKDDPPVPRHELPADHDPPLLPGADEPGNLGGRPEAQGGQAA